MIFNPKKQITHRKITVRDGSEGPKQDPYAFTEVSVEFQYAHFDAKHTFTHHAGLLTRLTLDGRTITDEKDKSFALFVKYCGASPQEFAESHERMKSRKCPKCGCSRTKEEEGYPGESFTVCAKCRTIRQSHFHLSEII